MGTHLKNIRWTFGKLYKMGHKKKRLDKIFKRGYQVEKLVVAE